MQYKDIDKLLAHYKIILQNKAKERENTIFLEEYLYYSEQVLRLLCHKVS